jgi:hypothetical protein
MHLATSSMSMSLNGFVSGPDHLDRGFYRPAQSLERPVPAPAGPAGVKGGRYSLQGAPSPSRSRGPPGQPVDEDLVLAEEALPPAGIHGLYLLEERERLLESPLEGERAGQGTVRWTSAGRPCRPPGPLRSPPRRAASASSKRCRRSCPPLPCPERAPSRSARRRSLPPRPPASRRPASPLVPSGEPPNERQFEVRQQHARGPAPAPSAWRTASQRASMPSGSHTSAERAKCGAASPRRPAARSERATRRWRRGDGWPRDFRRSPAERAGGRSRR